MTSLETTFTVNCVRVILIHVVTSEEESRLLTDWIFDDYLSKKFEIKPIVWDVPTETTKRKASDPAPPTKRTKTESQGKSSVFDRLNTDSHKGTSQPKSRSTSNPRATTETGSTVFNRLGQRQGEAEPIKPEPKETVVQVVTIKCRFGIHCTNWNCPYEHPERPPESTQPTPTPPIPVVCRYHPGCLDQFCRFLHPTGDTPIVPKTTIVTQPSETMCRFGLGCLRPGCFFKHPEGFKKHLSERGFAATQSVSVKEAPEAAVTVQK